MKKYMLYIFLMVLSAIPKAALGEGGALPVAGIDGGRDTSVAVLTQVTLNASWPFSYSPENKDIKLYSWKYISGVYPVELSSILSSHTSFMLKKIGTYIFEVSVSDGENWSFPARITVQAGDYTPPLVNSVYVLPSGELGSVVQAVWDVSDNYNYFSQIKYCVSVDDAAPDTITGSTSKLFTGLAAGSHTLKFFAVDSSGNTSTAVTKTFQINSGRVIPENRWCFASIPAGADEISVPAYLQNPLGAPVIFRWAPDANPQPGFELYQRVEKVKKGEGFWIKAKTNTLISAEGLLNGDDSVSVRLKKGWNQIGNPFGFGINTDSLYIVSSDLTLHRFHGNNGYTDDVIWACDTDTVKAADFLEPWYGGWLYAFADATLVYRGVPAFKRSYQLAPAQAADEYNWEIALTLESSAGNDRSSSFGARLSALDGPDGSDHRKPPVMPPYAVLAFENDAISDDGAMYASDIRSSDRSRKDWRLVFKSDLENSNNRISWEQLPEAFPWNLYLEDATSGKLTDMKKAGSYEFHNAGAAERIFRISALYNEQLALTAVPGTVLEEYCYPNPLKDDDLLSFACSTDFAADRFKLVIYDISGIKILEKTFSGTSSLVSGYNYKFNINIKTDINDSISSGVYFYVLEVTDPSGGALTEKGKFAIIR